MTNTTNPIPFNLELVDATIIAADDIDDAIHDAIAFFIDPDEFDNDDDFDRYADALYQIMRPYARKLRWGRYE